MTRRHLIFLVRGVISVLLIGWLLSRIDLAEVRSAWLEPRWPLLLCALVVYGLSAVGGALQWSWILRVAGLQVPHREVRRLYFIGLFFNNFLPANVGGDAYKIVDLGRQQRKPMKVLCATLLDRLIGLSSLTLLALAVAVFATVIGVALPRLWLWLFAVLFMLWLVLGLLLSRHVGPRIPPLLDRMGLVRLAVHVATVVAEFRLYRERIGWLARIFAFSVGVQFLRILTHLVVAAGIGISLEFSQMVQLYVLVPMLAITLTLPITINGIGLRESVSANLLVQAGLSPAGAVAVEVAAYLVQVVFSLCGGVLFWWGRRDQPRPPQR